MQGNCLDINVDDILHIRDVHRNVRSVKLTKEHQILFEANGYSFTAKQTTLYRPLALLFQ